MLGARSNIGADCEVLKKLQALGGITIDDGCLVKADLAVSFPSPLSFRTGRVAERMERNYASDF